LTRKRRRTTKRSRKADRFPSVCQVDLEAAERKTTRAVSADTVARTEVAADRQIGEKMLRGRVLANGTESGPVPNSEAQVGVLDLPHLRAARDRLAAAKPDAGLGILCRKASGFLEVKTKLT